MTHYFIDVHETPDSFLTTGSQCRELDAGAAVRADFERMIAAIETPPQYVAWQVPVASARKPGAG